MAVLMMLALFAFFVGLDLGVQWWSRHRVLARERRNAGETAATDVVAGYHLARDVAYHPRHTWARVLDPVTVAVGIDDFAARLLGTASGLALPSFGQRLRRSETAFRVRGNGREASLAAPIDGEVIAVNEELDRNPGLCIKSPYDRGWLFEMRVPDAARSVRLLRANGAAHTWMQHERERLVEAVCAGAGGALADGGELVSDFSSRIAGEEWERLVDTFLTGNSPGRAGEDQR